MGYAFISYSSKNYDDARAMHKILTDRGIQVWMAPGDIPPGSNYAGVLTQAIRNSECLVLLLTAESQNSDHVDIELGRALSYKKPIIPIALDAITLSDSFEYYLGNKQIIPVKQISEDNKELLKTIDQIALLTGTEAVRDTDKNVCIDVTEKFFGRRILIYSLEAEKYASARLDLENAPVCCSTDNQAAWEIFRVMADDKGWASFMAYNDHYLTVRLDEEKTLPPIRAAASDNDLCKKFRIYKTRKGFAIKAACNEKWVTCRVDRKNKPLLASRDTPDSWEFFDIKTVPWD